MGVPLYPDLGIPAQTSGFAWINAVEGFFSTLTRQRLERDVFRSVDNLEQTIDRYIRKHNGDAKPFVWTKPANTILDKLNRLPEPSV